MSYPIEKSKPTQFKKGKSGNPKGKPVGTLSMTTKIKEFLMEFGKDGETNADKLKRAIVLRAITKSDVLVKEILDRTDGRVPFLTDITSGGEKLKLFFDKTFNDSTSQTTRSDKEQGEI